MASQYPSFNLCMLNLIIAMCRGSTGVPDLLQRLGYTDHYIELKFANSENRSVKPEIIIFSEQQVHTIMWEWKSGGNLCEDQLKRYAAVTGDDLRQRASVPVGACDRSDVALVIPECKTRDCRRVLQEWNLPFPLIAKDQEELSLVANEFAVERLSRELQGGLRVDSETPPLGFVPLELDSPEWVWSELVGQQLLDYMHKREPRITVLQMAQDIIPAWGVIAPNQQALYRDKLNRVMQDMARHEFKQYLRRNRQVEGQTHHPTWDIISNPLDETTDRRTGVFKDLQKRLNTCIGRLRVGQETLDLDEQ